MKKLLYFVLLVGLICVGTTVSALAQDEYSEEFREGQQYLQGNQFDKAAKVFEAIVREDDENSRGWFMLGYALHMAGDLDKAIRAHKKAAESEEFEAIATYNLGCAYSMLGQVDDAIEHLKKAVDLGYNDINQILEDADLYRIHRDVRFAKLMAELYDNRELVSLLNDAQQHLNDSEFEKAAVIYAKITAEDDENDFAWSRLGYSLHGAGRLEEAIKAHKKAAEFPAMVGLANYNLGCAYSLQENADEAFKHLQLAVKNGINDVNYFNQDPDLENIRKDERYDKLVSAIDARNKAKNPSIDEHEHEDGHENDHDHDDDDGY